MVDNSDNFRPAPPLQNLYTIRQFPEYNIQVWNEFSEYIYNHILVSTGQYPKLESTPLRAKIFGKIDREDYYKYISNYLLKKKMFFFLIT